MAIDDTIRQQAHDLVNTHGEDAPIQAAMKAHALLDQGDREGSSQWGQIGKLTNVLLSETAYAATTEPTSPGSGQPVGSANETITSRDLPSPNIRRWHVHHKATVVTAVQKGLLDLAEACARYKITTEEFLSWKRLLDEHGLHGLRTTRLKEYRQTGSSANGNGRHPAAVKTLEGGS